MGGFFPINKKRWGDGMVVQEENRERLHEVGDGGHRVMFQEVGDGGGG
jgi:hypothetical protein